MLIWRFVSSVFTRFQRKSLCLCLLIIMYIVHFINLSLSLSLSSRMSQEFIGKKIGLLFNLNKLFMTADSPLGLPITPWMMYPTLSVVKASICTKKTANNTSILLLRWMICLVFFWASGVIWCFLLYQAVCANLGHTVPDVIKEAINCQLNDLPYIYSGLALSEPRARLSELLSHVSLYDLLYLSHALS